MLAQTATPVSTNWKTGFHCCSRINSSCYHTLLHMILFVVLVSPATSTSTPSASLTWTAGCTTRCYPPSSRPTTTCRTPPLSRASTDTPTVCTTRWNTLTRAGNCVGDGDLRLISSNPWYYEKNLLENDRIITKYICCKKSVGGTIIKGHIDDCSINTKIETR